MTSGRDTMRTIYCEPAFRLNTLATSVENTSSAEMQEDFCHVLSELWFLGIESANYHLTLITQGFR